MLNIILLSFDYGLFWDADQKVDSKKSQRKTDEQGSGTKQAQSSSSSLKVNAPADTKVTKLREFTYRELVKATENFKNDRFLGEGGFGEVYKGKVEIPKQVTFSTFQASICSFQVALLNF